MIDSALGVLLELAIKSSVVLGLVFVVASLCRRVSAEERHLVWVSGLLGILALPVLPQPDLGFTAAGLLPETAAFLPVAPDPGAPPGAPAPAAKKLSAANAALPSAADAAPAILVAPARWPMALLGTYGAVAFALLLWLVVSSKRIGRSLRRLENVTHRPTLALLEAATARSGIRRRIEAKWSSHDATPLAWGFFRPLVVLPQDFTRLPPDEQRNAIEHEVAHIARWDFLTTSLAWVCCAVYWFQPLAWLACRRLMQESEIACDDRVLANGASGRDYARQLVDAAKTVSALRIRAAAMAGAGSVTRRITAILDPTKRRRTMSRLQSLSVLALATVLLVPFNALTAKPRAAAAAPDTTAGGEPDARALAAAGREGEAATLLADGIVESGAGGCSLCYDVLSRNNETSDAEARVVRRAFDLVEERARASGNGNLLVALAELCRRSGNGDELDRATWYLMEGFRLGGLTKESNLVALSILDDLGWYNQAKTLAQSLHDNPESGLYHSPETELWIKRLDRQLSQAEFVTSRLIEPKASVTIEGDLMPLYRVPPVYPPEALAGGQEADVKLRFTLSETGHPEDVTVVHSTNRAFDQPARDSVSQWLYAPQLVAGVPVEKPGQEVVIRFLLED